MVVVLVALTLKQKLHGMKMGICSVMLKFYAAFFFSFLLLFLKPLLKFLKEKYWELQIMLHLQTVTHNLLSDYIYSSSY
jgi:hypothetical protein